MHTVEKTTKAGEVEYTVSFNQFDGLPEALEKIGDEAAVLGVINAAQEQGAKQGGKEEVRSAIREFGLESDEVAASVATHQSRSAAYVIGAPRGSAGGITKTRSREFGAALRDKLSDEQMLALAEEYGVDL